MRSFLFCFLTVAFAYHFDYCTICWKVLSGTKTTQRTYEFTITEAFQRAFQPFVDELGHTITTADIGSEITASQGIFRFMPVGVLGYAALQNPTNHLGTAGLGVKIVQVNQDLSNVDQDWLVAKAIFQLTIPDNFDKNWFWIYNASARKNGLEDSNAGLTYQFTGVANRNDVLSICAVAGIPNTYVDLGVPNTLIIPTLNPSESNVSYTYSKQVESFLVTPFPSTPAQPAGQQGLVTVTDASQPEFRLNTDNGVYTWTPDHTGVYSLQFMIEKGCASDGTGQVCTAFDTQINCCSRTIYDFLLLVVNPDPLSPQFVSPFPQTGAGSDPLDRVLYANESEPFTMRTCVNIFGATIYPGDLPPNATLTGPVPTPPAPAGQTCYDLTWPSPQSDAIVCFGAKSMGHYSHGQYCITIIVRHPIILSVWNLPPLLEDEVNNWYALPSSPQPHVEVIVMKIVSKVPYFGSCYLSGLMNPYQGEKKGPFQFQHVKNSDGDQFLTYNLGWTATRLGNWLMTVECPQDKHHFKGIKSFPMNYHYIGAEGRFVLPWNQGKANEVTRNVRFSIYNLQWSTTQGGYNVFANFNNSQSNPTSAPFYGFSRFTSTPMECSYKQSMGNQLATKGGATGNVESYEWMMIPLLGPVPTLSDSGPNKEVQSAIKRFAIGHNEDFPVDTHFGARYNIPIGQSAQQSDPKFPPTPCVKIFGTYCIDSSRFTPFSGTES